MYSGSHLSLLSDLRCVWVNGETSPVFITVSAPLIVFLSCACPPSWSNAQRLSPRDGRGAANGDGNEDRNERVMLWIEKVFKT